MPAPCIILKVDAASFMAALDELDGLLAGRSLQLEGDLARKFSQLFVDGVFDAAQLIRTDGESTANSAGDVLIPFEPSDIFLELLSALRAGHCDRMFV